MGGLMAVLLLVLCVLMWGIGSVEASLPSERFTERLALRPLPDGGVASRFEFVSDLGESSQRRHHKLFPKAILQLVEKFHIQEMDLSFTQGRWDHRRWGAWEGTDVKPGGVELRAQFHPSSDIDLLWRNLTHALSGLFCASINFLENPATVSKSGALRQGALPREAVCTENLTPWLKLLPCRDRAGLSTLLDRPRIHNGKYYSLRVHVTARNAIDRPKTSLRLSQTLTVVLKSSAGSVHRPNWSLSSLFGRPLVGSCPLASSSRVHLELEANLVEEMKRAENYTNTEHLDMTSNAIFDLTVPPEAVDMRSASVLLNYDVQKCSAAHPLDVGMAWRAALAWSPRQAPFRATQFLTGRGNGRGAIVSVVNANRDGLWCDDAIEVTTFQIVPWYVRLYMHTLKVVVDGERVELHEGVRLKLSPADDRNSPAVVEIGVTIPCNASTVVFSLEFDKGYLRIDEHPPDANRGFDIPSALFTFGSSSSQQIHSDNLLVLLATPDFSMPYNVITFTMTALALYFGSLLNSLRLRSVSVVQVQEPGARVSVKVMKLLGRFRGREKVKTL